MPNRYHYTKEQHKTVMRWWFEVAVPNKWTQAKASNRSQLQLGFHVPASTLSLWIGKYRKHRKANPVVGPSQTVKVPFGVVKISGSDKKVRILSSDVQDTRTEKQLLAILIAEQREANATLNIIARHAHRQVELIEEVQVNPKWQVLEELKTERPWWKLW